MIHGIIAFAMSVVTCVVVLIAATLFICFAFWVVALAIGTVGIFISAELNKRRKARYNSIPAVWRDFQ